MWYIPHGYLGGAKAHRKTIIKVRTKKFKNLSYLQQNTEVNLLELGLEFRGCIRYTQSYPYRFFALKSYINSNCSSKAVSSCVPRLFWVSKGCVSNPSLTLQNRRAGVYLVFTLLKTTVTNFNNWQ